MRIRLGLPELPGRVRRDDTVLPAACVDICENAYLEAQSIGKTPALCDPRFGFRNYYDGCQACIGANVADVKLVTQTYLDPMFGQFLEYCASAPTITSTSIDSALLASISSSISKAIETIKGNATIPTDYFTPTTETTAVAATFPDGSVTTVPITRAWMAPNSKFFGTATTTVTLISTPPPTLPAETAADQQSTSNAWIAGPVVGAVVGVLLLAFAGFFFLHVRPWRKATAISATEEQQAGEEKDTPEKAQLHSDSVPRAPPQELPGGKTEHSDVFVNERPAVELPADHGQGLPGR
ncbi:hypothetical protein QBC34DRAFT_416036 [Podospora aff. communis PSN243]|uniref:Uncharacterized protein n=1 Tax=Podospora aff. communis PSN243 TaxID=3040156 RepID=A0AAV9G6R4_9PEZI|nr:hypothetical protein QBC34DRAFT_416036 [Podospora aff. communis PSN243]